MSRPVTRNLSKKITNPEPHQPEPPVRNPEPSVSNPAPPNPKPVSSKASTVSQNNSDLNRTVRSNASSILVKKKEAELAAAKRLAEANRRLAEVELQSQKIVIEKELQVQLARLNSNESRRSGSTRSSRVQDWISTELLPNEQERPNDHPTHIAEERIQTLQPNVKRRKEMTREEQMNPELTDIQLLAREIGNLRRPYEPKELPYYSGTVSEWLSFKAAVAEIRPTITDIELISRFRRCLKGEARVTVAALLDTQVPPSEIMEALELRFGLPELILHEEIQALKDLPRLIDNTEQLSKFACKVRNCVSTIKALKKPEHLFNTELIRNLKQKIPHLKTRWIAYAVEHEDDNEPELIKLSNFLKKEAQSVSKHWLHEPSRTPSKQATPNRTHYAELEEDDPEPCYASNPRKDPVEMNCPCCKSTAHRLLKDCEQFLRLSNDDRWKWAKDVKMCFKCLKARHYREYCRARPCGIDGCRMSHNELLHSPTSLQPQTSACIHPQAPNDQAASEAAVDKAPNEMTACSRTNLRSQVLLKIIPIEIRGPTATKRTYALLDGGSTLTLLKHELAKEIGLKGITAPLTLSGINATTEEPDSERVDLQVIGPSKATLDLHGVRTVRRLPLAPQTVTDVRGYSHLQDLPRIGLCYEHAVPELLIGQDNWHAIVSTETRRGQRNEPVASLTPLGWVVHGFSHSYTDVVHFVGHTEADMHQLVADYFKIDSLGVATKMKQNAEDQRAIEILQRTARRVEDGKRWEVGLLWRENEPTMPESFFHASKRLRSIEKKMDKDPAYGQKYKENMDNFLRSGYAGSCNPTQSPKKWYLPHFGVTNINKPGKLRIVHDAASRVQGVSLNDKLLTGPDLLLSLLAVLFKFREGKIAASADIKEMFLQIRIRPEDRPAQRFLWREFDREGPAKEFEMKSVIFGATCSPATAIYIKNRNAEDFTEQYPEAVDAVKTRFYMDDYLHSFHSEETARKIVKEVNHINLEGGFTLTQWISNNANAIQDIEDSKRGSGGVNLDFNVTVKILGMKWNPADDTLGFNLNLSKLPAEIIDHSRKPTKREALRVVMSVFDPLGLLTPIIIQGKILLQHIWRSGIDWDQHVHDTEHAAWKRWIKRLITVCLCRIPRHYGLDPAQCDIELHIFCDASERSYATVAYWRFVREDGEIWVTLITSKSRVAPLKPVSIPRLELQAAVLGTRLACAIEEDHTIEPSKRFFWTDSSAVISWVKGDPRNYKTFISNRLGEIAEYTKTSEWRWLPTSLNVADDATRDLDNLDIDHRWFKGPSFLYQEPHLWPVLPDDNNLVPNDVLEMKKQAHGSFPTQQYVPTLPDITRFSKWLRLIRSTAYIFAFSDNTRKKERGDIKLQHLERAEETWIKHCQNQSFSEELENLKNNKPINKNSRLRNICTFIDDRGLMRLQGRANAVNDIDKDLMQPVVLDGKHPYTRLLTQHHHEQANHENNETVVNSMRQKYWIINVRPTVRAVAKACQLCRIRKAAPMRLPLGNLPPARLAHHLRPFTHCGLDYFGPMVVTIGRRHEKRYGALFTCMTSRAVHIELASTLSTDSVILALRRMMARRGPPEVIYSDNGTNFHGANTELKNAAKEMDQGLINNYLINKKVNWSFIPPASPHMAGSWERLIRCIKRALTMTLKEQSPTEEVLRTVLTEAEHTVNSRPLTYVSVRPDDREAITPNHLLLPGTPRIMPHFGIFNEDDMITRKQWRRAQRLCDIFWSRWVREYLPTLLPRAHVLERPDLKEGDVVVIVDPALPRNIWPKGIIIKVFPGPDGRVRVADVRTTGGVLRRPAVKIVRLPTDPECA